MSSAQMALPRGTRFSRLGLAYERYLEFCQRLRLPAASLDDYVRETRKLCDVTGRLRRRHSHLARYLETIQ